MEKKCSRCKFFTAYYEKAYACFLRTDCGKCFISKSTVSKNKAACENWQAKYLPYKAGKRHYQRNTTSRINHKRDRAYIGRRGQGGLTHFFDTIFSYFAKNFHTRYCVPTLDIHSAR